MLKQYDKGSERTHVGTEYFDKISYLDGTDYPFNVQDLFRARKYYTNMEDLNDDIDLLQKKFKITRLKNKTSSDLSLIQLNFIYTLDFDGESK